MSCEKLVIAAVVAVATLAAAMPRAHPRTVELMDAVNKTVCPIEVEVDEDPERIPRRIKVLKCAADPGRRCHEQGIPRRDCCAHHHQHHIMECVEIVDTVLVQYPHSDSPHKAKQYRVPVGCTCMVEQSTLAAPAT